ncbi:unnamed protein product [Menidia menidia]|uniref:(Atlantic silverside) hypothetical protein n=1 Tax=Menidia menidia TaxID=238744 RepID=A0A8S4BYW7_9TELE|nr:unnamed protein product [Menidia menidia]CAG6020376.1 unnamed protein product [Menidia menidia]
MLCPPFCCGGAELHSELFNLSALCCFLSAGQRINIKAEAGQNVTLPCGAGKEKIRISLLEWTRPGLEKKEKIRVFTSRNGHPDPDLQHPSFRNRVYLQDGQMKDGDASLNLNDLKINDTATYECRVIQREEKTGERSVHQTSIHLEVSLPRPGTEERGGKEGGGKEGGGKEGGGKEREGKEGGGKEGGGKERGGFLGLTLGLLVLVLFVVVVVVAVIYKEKPSWFKLCSCQPPAEPKPDETEISTSGTQTAASSPEIQLILNETFRSEKSNQGGRRQGHKDGGPAGRGLPGLVLGLAPRREEDLWV